MKKSRLILIILFTLIVGIGLGVGAATLFASDQVLYKDTTTVKGALDDLYDKSIYGNATAAQILSGKTALVGGSKITGNIATVTNDGTHIDLNGATGFVTNESVPLQLTMYDNDGILNSKYVNKKYWLRFPASSIASAIGLTAAKIAKGNTILGIAGTYTGGNARYGSLSAAVSSNYTINTGLSSITHFMLFSKEPSGGFAFIAYSPTIFGSGYYYGGQAGNGGGATVGKRAFGNRDNAQIYFMVNSVSGGNISISTPTSTNWWTPGTLYWLAY